MISHASVVRKKPKHFISSYISVLFDTQETDNFLNITVEFYCILPVNNIFITIERMIHNVCQRNADDVKT